MRTDLEKLEDMITEQKLTNIRVELNSIGNYPVVFEYDVKGNMIKRTISRTDGEVDVIEYSYDDQNRIILRKMEKCGEVSHLYKKSKTQYGTKETEIISERYSLDTFNKTTTIGTILEGDSKTIKKWVDVNGKDKLLSTTVYINDLIISEKDLNGKTKYEYSGNLLIKTRYTDYVNVHETLYEYDIHSNLLHECKRDTKSKNIINEISYSYDHNHILIGMLKMRFDSDNIEYKYEYNNVNKLIKKTRIIVDEYGTKHVCIEEFIYEDNILISITKTESKIRESFLQYTKIKEEI